METILVGYTFKSHLDSESWNRMTLDLIYYNDCCYEQRILNTILDKSCWMQQLGGLNMYWINAHHHVNSKNFKNQIQSQTIQKVLIARSFELYFSSRKIIITYFLMKKTHPDINAISSEVINQIWSYPFGVLPRHVHDFSFQS